MNKNEMTLAALVLFAGGVLSYFFIPGMTNFLPDPIVPSAPVQHTYILHVYTMTRCSACDELARALKSPDLKSELPYWQVRIHKDEFDEAKARGVEAFPTLLSEVDGVFEAKEEGFNGNEHLLSWLREQRHFTSILDL